MKAVEKFFAFLFALAFFSGSVYSQRFALIDYMKVPEGGDGEYLKVEQEVWKPMHQEWVNQGKLESWSVWSIPYPGGTDAEYHYVTVQIYNGAESLENRMADIESVFKKVHPDTDADKAFARTLASRDLVKANLLINWERFSDTTETVPAKYLTVVYFKIPMKNWDAYQDMERTYYHPTHKAEIEADCRQGWSGWQLIRPFGEDQPFQFIAVDLYKDWAQYVKPIPEGLAEKTLSKDDLEKREQLFYETVTLSNLEEWRLVDSTTPKKK